MGIRINALTDTNNKFVKAADEYLEIFIIKYFSIFKSWYYRFTNDYKIEQEALKTLKNLTQVVISNKRMNKDNKTVVKSEEDFGIKPKMALLDMLMNLNEKDSLTEEELNDQVNTFLFAVRMK